MAKKIKKIIPKEIKPALPALAAIFGPAALATYGPAAFSGTGVLASLPARAMISSAIAQAATTGKLDPKQTALAGLQAYGGEKLTAMGVGAPKGSFKEFLGKTGQYLAPDVKDLGFTEGLKAGAKAAIPQASVAYAQEAKLLNEKALRDYEAQLREQGIMDSADRRNKIFGYFTNAGYSADETNAFLDKYGYATGGRVGLKKGGEIGIEVLYRGLTPSARKVVNTIENAVPNEDDENYEDDDGFKIYPKGTTSTYDLNLDAFKDEDDDEEKLTRAVRKGNYDLSKGLQSAVSGLEMAFGRPIDMRPERTRFGLAEGGIPALKVRKTIAELIQTGVLDEEDVEEAIREIQGKAMMAMRAPAMAEGGIMNLGGREMDMRGGGFIPIGAKEKADDVPARLSKNEFVMTADAVRAAGGGSVNKGAKRMYDLMNRLEAKV